MGRDSAVSYHDKVAPPLNSERPRERVEYPEDWLEGDRTGGEVANRDRDELR